MTGVVIELTDQECAAEDRRAEVHFARAQKRGWQGVGYHGPQRLRGNQLGYRAERAVKKWLGRNDPGDPDGFGKADAGRFSVRYGMRSSYGLVIHDRDGEKDHILVVPDDNPDDPRRFRLVGWLSTREARIWRARGCGRPLPGSTSAWAIPQTCLHELSELPEFAHKGGV